MRKLFKTEKHSSLITGNRIPKDFFVTHGYGQSDITVHAGSYHLALKEAGIECYNIITYSSILPAIAREVAKPKNYVHGSVAETIMAVANSKKGQRATAGIIYGWLYDKQNGKKYGGLVCEYNGSFTEKKAGESLKASLNELYVHGFSEKYSLQETRLLTKSFVPTKKYGTCLIALCFVNYIYPLIDKKM